MKIKRNVKNDNTERSPKDSQTFNNHFGMLEVEHG